MTEPEEIEGSSAAARAGSVTAKRELVLSQPEIIAWLRLSEPEVAAWLGPHEKDEDDEAATSAS